jgi:hypothetical protein
MARLLSSRLASIRSMRKHVWLFGGADPVVDYERTRDAVENLGACGCLDYRNETFWTYLSSSTHL